MAADSLGTHQSQSSSPLRGGRGLQVERFKSDAVRHAAIRILGTTIANHSKPYSAPWLEETLVRLIPRDETTFPLQQGEGDRARAYRLPFCVGQDARR